VRVCALYVTRRAHHGISLLDIFQFVPSVALSAAIASFVLTLNRRPLNFPGLSFVRFATLHHLFCHTAGLPSKFSNYLDTHLNLKRKGSFVLFFLPKSSLFFPVDYLVRSPYHFKCCATLGRTLTRRFSGGFFTWVALMVFFSNMGSSGLGQ
jgi:hypothetical protein